MLFSYLQRTQLLLNDAGIAQFNPADLITYINLGRQQIASAGECVRAVGTLTLISGTSQYPFSAITVGTSGASAGGVVVVRNVNVPATQGYGPISGRNFDWYTLFYIQTSQSPATGTPNTWSQFGRGTKGQLYFYPTPASGLNCTLDCVALPNAMSLDSDPEAIPYPWTDAVPFYAAYYAAMTTNNFDSANTFWAQFETYMRRAGSESTATMLPDNYVGGIGARAAALKQPLTMTPGGNS